MASLRFKPECPKLSRGCARGWAKDNVVLVSTAIAIILGVILGLALRQADLSHDAIVWVKIWGELFLRMLKLIILPLIMACLIMGEDLRRIQCNVY